MAGAQCRDSRMSVADDRVWAEGEPDSGRRGLPDGIPVPMSPTSGRHLRIVANRVRRLDELAERGGCGDFPGLAVTDEAMDGIAPITDIVVECDPLPRDGDTRDPLLLTDVLASPTTTRDRGRKADILRTVAAPQAFPIVCRDDRRLEVRRRETGWAMRKLGRDGVAALPERDGILHVTDVYARATF